MKLIFSSCDTGSANALAPVLSGLSCDYFVLAQKEAARVFDQWKIPYQLLGPIGWDELLFVGNKVLSLFKAKGVVTGTSWGPSIDKALTMAARRQSIPCASLVEHWDLYMERFSGVNNGVIFDRGKYLPDRIWVNDEIARAEASSAGLPADVIEVVGQPHLEHQLQLLRRRGKKLLPKGVVFISERVGEDFTVGSPLYRGFDEFSALEQLVASIDLSDSNLVIKLHPQESEGKFDDLLAGRRNVDVVKDVDNLNLVANAGKLVGMFSMLLLEAALIRSDVISFLPGGNPYLFIGNRVGATIPATTKEELKILLNKAATEPSCNDVKITSFGERFVGSTMRMTEAIGRLVA